MRENKHNNHTSYNTDMGDSSMLKYVQCKPICGTSDVSNSFLLLSFIVEVNCLQALGLHVEVSICSLAMLGVASDDAF